MIVLNYPVILSHRRSTTVSLETYPLYSFIRFIATFVIATIFHWPNNEETYQSGENERFRSVENLDRRITITTYQSAKSEKKTLLKKEKETREKMLLETTQRRNLL